MNETEKRIQQVMAVVFGVAPESIDNNSSQDNIESWDSVRHLDLITALEEEFEITVPLEEVGNMLNFQLVDIVVDEQLKNK
jgi:acyl carrier protein